MFYRRGKEKKRVSPSHSLFLKEKKHCSAPSKDLLQFSSLEEGGLFPEGFVTGNKGIGFD
jgi:hypothetical protein